MVAGLSIAAFVVFPIAFAYGYAVPIAPEIGVPYETVTVRTSDSLDLVGRPVEERGRDRRLPRRLGGEGGRGCSRTTGTACWYWIRGGRGKSEGDLVRWAGDRDLAAAAATSRRPARPPRTAPGSSAADLPPNPLRRIRGPSPTHRGACSPPHRNLARDHTHPRGAPIVFLIY